MIFLFTSQFGVIGCKAAIKLLYHLIVQAQHSPTFCLLATQSPANTNLLLD